MTRTKKLELIEKYRPYLFKQLLRKVPNLVKNPDTASQKEVYIYNLLLEEEALQDPRSAQFAKNFSF